MQIERYLMRIVVDSAFANYPYVIKSTVQIGSGSAFAWHPGLAL